MSKGSSLKSLIKEIPTPPETAAIFQRLRHSSDLAIAITTASIIDSNLEEVLRFRMDPLRDQLVNSVFDTQGPLSSLSAKVNIAQAFEFIDEKIANEIHTVRRIRNTFAHAKKVITFHEPAIQREMNKLLAVSYLKKEEKRQKISLNWDAKRYYLNAVEMIVAYLSTRSGDTALADALEKIYQDD